MTEETEKMLTDMINKMKPPEQKGFIFLPSVNGFDIFEFDADTLKAVITLINSNDLTNKDEDTKNKNRP